MARVTVEDCLEKVDNRFALVHIAALRARALLNKDASPLVQAPKNKETTVALREIAQELVRPAAEGHKAKKQVPTGGRGRQRRTPRAPRAQVTVTAAMPQLAPGAITGLRDG